MTLADPRPAPSPRPVVAATLAFASAFFFVVLLFEDFADLAGADLSRLPWGAVLRYVAAMALGGALAGALLAGLFGRRGWPGWLLAGLGGVVATTFAGVLGSLFGLLPDIVSDGWQRRDAVAIGSGALVLPFAAVGWPFLLVLWAALIARAHLRARRLRAPG
jgi:hypothetical protein